MKLQVAEIVDLYRAYRNVTKCNNSVESELYVYIIYLYIHIILYQYLTDAVATVALWDGSLRV